MIIIRFHPKRSFASLWICILTLASLSAQQHDKVWVIGYGHGSPGDTTYRLSFAEDTMNLTVFSHANGDANMALWGPFQYSISDSLGNLQFYTNGARIADANGMLLSGGDSLMLGKYIKLYYEDPVTLGPEFMTIFPWPARPGTYSAVYNIFDYFPDSQIFRSDHVFSRTIDMNQGANGAVLPGQDTLLNVPGIEIGQIIGTKHANGRDWWVLIRENYPSRMYHRLLLTPEGWRTYPPIEAGEGNYGFPDLSPPTQFYAAGDVIFTPDGSKHIRVGPKELYVFDFDRCGGTLSNYRKISRPNIAFSASIAVSPNSRYLYWCTSDKLFQYDLQDTTADMGELMVAQWDGRTSPFATNFIYAQLGPDGKIYMNAGSSTDKLQVVMQPDSHGVACHVVQQAVSLPGYACGFPNYPNYRLGPVPGGGCDSTPGGVLLGVAHPLPEALEGSGVRIWPNPAREQVTIALPSAGSGELRLLSATGSVVKLLTFSQVATLRLDLAGVPAGVYVCEVRIQEGNLFTHKLMILP